MKICIPSYNRPNVESLKILTAFNQGDVYIFVNNYDTEENLDRACNDYIRELPKEFEHANIVPLMTKGIPSVRNAILNYFSKDEQLLILDDDVIAIQELYTNPVKLKKELMDLSTYEIKDFIKEAFEVTEANNAKLWGVSPVPNAFYMSNKLNNKGFVIGSFYGVINNKLRYDEELPLKEDYDFTLKNIIEYKKIVRFDAYTVKARHYDNAGGCVDIRKANPELEEECFFKLLSRYPNLVRINPKRPNEILLKI